MAYAERLSKTKGLIILHPLLVTLILLASYPITHSIPTEFWYIILTSFIAAILLLLLQQWFDEPVILYLLFLLDIPLIGLMIHYTGGLESMFPLLYLLLIILSSIYLYRRGAYIIALSAAAFFIALLLVEARGSTYPIRVVMYRFYIFTLLFLLTAIMSGVLSARYQRRTEEAKRLRLTTEEIIKNLPSGIITVDDRGDVIYTNITEGSIRSKVYMHISKFLKHTDTPSSIELKIAKRYYVFSCARIYNSKAALGVLQDLTNFRRLQEASRISKQTKLLAELGGSLAHEIRNPLSSIKGSLEVIRETEKKKNVLPFIDMAIKESSRLNDIVTDFLNFAQFTPIKRNRVAISEVISEALIDTMRGAAQKELEIRRKDNNFFVLADLNKLKSSFTNILNNAYEVSKRGHVIEIRSYKNKREGIVEFRDSGDGIPKKYLKKIFFPFFTTKKGGTGLGLAITKNIIEAHHGKIEVKSKSGKGTTFIVRLPLA
ncbi:MAG: GHKL domain-containing protein [candidate division WOR-3 bacterium]|nr:MAG: GHKL domain-containing protein [candidate division WOR-3 bacterium]